jgi:glutaredoxin
MMMRKARAEERGGLTNEVRWPREERRKKRRAPKMKSVTLYTRRKCCLCSQAVDVLEGLQDKIAFELLVVDIDRDLVRGDNRHSRLAIEVPVVELDGREVIRYQVTEEEMMGLLLEDGSRG